MTKLSNNFFRRQIEDHFDQMDLDVVVRKRRHAYAIYWEDDNEPLARLRPTGRKDEVKVSYWADDHWEQTSEIDSAQPLDEALKYITDDPSNRFFDNESDEDDGFAELDEPNALQAARSAYVILLTCSLIGGAAGGMFYSVWWGLAISSAVATMVCAIPTFINRCQTFLKDLALSTLVVPFACVAAITGSAANSGLGGGGYWSIAGGMIVAVCCSLMLFAGGVFAWITGLLAGLNLAVAIFEIVPLENNFGRLFLVTLVAAAGAQLCYTIMNRIAQAVDLMTGRLRRSGGQGVRGSMAL